MNLHMDFPYWRWSIQLFITNSSIRFLYPTLGPDFFFWLISNSFQATLESRNCYQRYFACCSERNHHTAKVNHLLGRDSGSGIQNQQSSVAKQQESVLKLEEEFCTVFGGITLWKSLQKSSSDPGYLLREDYSGLASVLARQALILSNTLDTICHDLVQPQESAVRVIPFRLSAFKSVG